jgi:15-cis-phytoene synthase
MTAPAAEAAYDVCRRTTRSSGSSFYRGMSLLPRGRRDAIFAIYALARRIDDVADGALPPAQKLEELARLRSELAHIDRSDDPVLVAVRDAAGRFPIPLSAFDELVDGADMDARGHTYSTFAELELYCRCVAGSIGRLSLGVFETASRDVAEPLADELGIALQLGNILRDLTEDLARNRVYLPEEDLARFDCAAVDGAFEGPLELVVAFEAERALGRLRRGLELVPLLDRRSAAAVLAMAGSYRYLLRRIAAHPETVLDGRPSLRGWTKSWLLVRGVAGGLR